MEAFSITEMLITMVMGVAVLGVTAQLLASHTRVSTSSTELLQRRADWSKFSYLITTEAEESQDLELGVPFQEPVEEEQPLCSRSRWRRRTMMERISKLATFIITR